MRSLSGGFTNEVQHVELLSLAVARPASLVVHCFMIGVAVKGDPQERGARAGRKSAPLTATPIMKERRHAKTGSGVLRVL